MFDRSGMQSWLMQRITAVIILVGLVFHFVYMHWFIERPVTKAKVLEVMGSPGWILFDTVLLMAALYHMCYGIFGVYLDFNPGERSKKVVTYAFWIVGVAAVVFGVYALVAMRGGAA